MKEKRMPTGWRKGFAIGGAALCALVFLMAVGLTAGRREKPAVNVTDVGGRDVSGTVGEVGEKGAVVPEGADMPAAPGRESAARTRVQQVPRKEAKVMKTGTVSIEIERGSYDDRYAEARRIAEGAAGMIADSRSTSSEGRITGGTVTLRVPNESFSAVMEQVRGLGKVTAVTEQVQDITEEYVDLESRIRNLRAQESVYVALMGRAQTVEEAISVQRELSVVQGQIEELAGRKNYLDNRVSDSTVQLTMNEPGTGVADGEEGWGFLDALMDALHGVVDGINAVIRFVGNALVYVVLLGLAGFGVYYLARKRSGEKRSG